jgi:hypothetical protein
MTLGGTTLGGAAVGSTSTSTPSDAGSVTVTATLSGTSRGLAPLTGTVTQNETAVEGANVFAVFESDLSYIGGDTTDANGNYQIQPFDTGVILVGVDFDDNGTRFGRTKSIDYTG